MNEVEEFLRTALKWVNIASWGGMGGRRKTLFTNVNGVAYKGCRLIIKNVWAE